MDLLGKAFHLGRPEIAIFEKITEELPRLRCDHDGGGLGKSLQSRGEVRRFAYYPTLLPLARGDQVADHDLTGGDTNANSQRLELLQSRDSVHKRKARTHGLL